MVKKYKKNAAYKGSNIVPNNTKAMQEVITEQEMKSQAKELYFQIWKKRNELKSLAQRYSRLTRQIIGITDDELKRLE